MKKITLVAALLFAASTVGCTNSSGTGTGTKSSSTGGGMSKPSMEGGSMTKTTKP